MGTSKSPQLQMPCQEERQISTGYCQTFPVSLNNSSLRQQEKKKCRVHSEPCLLYVTKVGHSSFLANPGKKNTQNDSTRQYYCVHPNTPNTHPIIALFVIVFCTLCKYALSKRYLLILGWYNYLHSNCQTCLSICI